jgi:hypothetical protein
VKAEAEEAEVEAEMVEMKAEAEEVEVEAIKVVVEAETGFEVVVEVGEEGAHQSQYSGQFD